ncbi:hypothetical protein QJS64_19680 (plasmid) [Paraclostridium bifermentans]|uniref:Uncharacterized protein n=1 Tax=Paraclostridium bifermentans TaxID=1490 RepID=A0ABY8R9K5_PARBF|nr:hypothetical protein QJS64_19680 [Paraclostridium bifermentans]
MDATKFGGQVYRFHNENVAYTTEELLAAVNGGTLQPKMITFRGEQYGPRPFGLGGIAMSSDGTVEKPTLTVSNIDAQASALFAPTTASCKPKLRYGFWSRNCYKTTAALKRAILGDLSTTSSAQNRSTRKRQRSN